MAPSASVLACWVNASRWGAEETVTEAVAVAVAGAVPLAVTVVAAAAVAAAAATAAATRTAAAAECVHWAAFRRTSRSRRSALHPRGAPQLLGEARG